MVQVERMQLVVFDDQGHNMQSDLRMSCLCPRNVETHAGVRLRTSSAGASIAVEVVGGPSCPRAAKNMWARQSEVPTAKRKPPGDQATYKVVEKR